MVVVPAAAAHYARLSPNLVVFPPKTCRELLPQGLQGSISISSRHNEYTSQQGLHVAAPTLHQLFTAAWIILKAPGVTGCSPIECASLQLLAVPLQSIATTQVTACCQAGAHLLCPTDRLNRAVLLAWLQAL